MRTRGTIPAAAAWFGITAVLACGRASTSHAAAGDLQVISTSRTATAGASHTAATPSSRNDIAGDFDDGAFNGSASASATIAADGSYAQGDGSQNSTLNLSGTALHLTGSLSGESSALGRDVDLGTPRIFVNGSGGGSVLINFNVPYDAVYTLSMSGTTSAFYEVDTGSVYNATTAGASASVTRFPVGLSSTQTMASFAASFGGVTPVGTGYPGGVVNRYTAPATPHEVDDVMLQPGQYSLSASAGGSAGGSFDVGSGVLELRGLLSNLNVSITKLYDITNSVAPNEEGQGTVAYGQANGGAGTPGGVNASIRNDTSGGTFSATYDTTFTEEELGMLGAPELPEGFSIAAGGAVHKWDVSYTGTFDGPITLTFGYDPDELPLTSASRILHLQSNGTWETLTPRIDELNRVFEVTTFSLSPFVAFTAVPEPSSIGAALVMAGGLLLRRRRVCRSHH